MHRLRGPLLVAVAMSTLLTGCSLRGLNFVRDDRVKIVTPARDSVVRLPVTVDWTVKDFETGPGRGSFAVFVDGSPQAPGRTLAHLFRNDKRCRVDPECPDAADLAERRIYTTFDSTFVIEELPFAGSDDGKQREFHDVTIVLLDAEGKRIGESAFARRFELIREET